MRATLVGWGCLESSFAAEVVCALRRGGVEAIEHGEPGVLGQVVLLAPDWAKFSAFAAEVDGCRIAVARSRDGFLVADSWRLLSAGFSDLVIWDELSEPGEAVVARLRRYVELREILDSPLVTQNLVGRSPAWRRVLRQVVETARYTDASLLITGESGTGKELVARLLHTLDARSPKGPLVTLDCTTVAPELSGSEFFGHERGAFTSAIAAREGAFARADQGTLFLDEVGELPLALQAELLRVVQERQFKRVGGNDWRHTDFRLVCATNRDLRAAREAGSFRLDFFHRIAATTVHLPPLRDRREDILPLARHFLRATVPGYDEAGLDPAVEDYLQNRDYPGNIRELRQVVLRMAKRHVGGGPITVGDVPESDRESAIALVARDWAEGELETAVRRALAGGVRLPDLKERVAEVAIELAIQDAEGNLRRAALRLGVTDRALQLRRASRRNGLGAGGVGAVTPEGPSAAPRDRSPPGLPEQPAD